MSELAVGLQRSKQSLVGSDRVLAVLAVLAEHPFGITLDDITRIMGSPKPTVHRALAALCRAGFAGQPGRGIYVLGDEFLRLAYRFQERRPETARVGRILEELALQYSETAHYAVLDGTDVVYRAKVDPPNGAVRLASTVGGRNPAYCTAVGKVLMSSFILSESQLAQWLGCERLEARTPNTLVTVPALYAELQRTRERGYGLDDQESELGVNCVALPVAFDASASHAGAISVSGLAFRCPLEVLVSLVPQLRAVIERGLEWEPGNPSAKSPDVGHSVSAID
jgi:DNA-binding IclR family transcriptional regulator